ncbi:YbjN domain-containing protein [Chlamydiifrater phoenicopteri]|uniref:YbjN domain-containing protein n=1 Tax=Chlamydiifrater phoenicopteri TaxID=2681469 RepID=UPI001BCD2BD0|nr:YbjN domain-containing protein [Chlamydiifrater phoenicopteri]
MTKTWTLNQNNLLNFLRENNFTPFEETTSRLSYINLNADDHEIPLFFVIRNEGEILQLIAYLPFQLKDPETQATARLLHLLNRDLDIPGFGMDEEQGLMFYRLVIPCLNKQIDGKLLLVYINTVQLACDSFSHAIGLISSGSMNLDELQREVRKENRSK